MTWHTQIEIYTSRSPYLEEIELLAKKTASKLSKADNTITIEYDSTRTLDLQAMIDKVSQWKSASLFIDGHIVDWFAARMMLRCLNYGFGNAPGTPLCQLCPKVITCEIRLKRLSEDVKPMTHNSGIGIGINGYEVLKQIVDKSLENDENNTPPEVAL